MSHYVGNTTDMVGEDGLTQQQRSERLQAEVLASGSKCPMLNLVDDREHHPYSRPVRYTIAHVTQLLHRDPELVEKTQAGLFRIIEGRCSSAVLIAVVTTRDLVARVQALEEPIYCVCRQYYRCVPPIRTWWVEDPPNGRPVRAPMACTTKAGQAGPSWAQDQYLGHSKYEVGFENGVHASMVASYRSLEKFAKTQWAKEEELARRLAAEEEQRMLTAADDGAAPAASGEAKPEKPEAPDAAPTDARSLTGAKTAPETKGKEVAKKRGPSSLRALFSRKKKTGED